MSNRSNDAKNGFSGKFYIDIVIRKFSQLFCFDRKKLIFLKVKNIFWKSVYRTFLLMKNFKNFEILTKKKSPFSKKVEKFFESLYRCKIFRRIHFSHPWSDLTSLNCSFGSPPFPPDLTQARSPPIEILWCDLIYFKDLRVSIHLC